MAEILFLQRGNHRATDDFERFLDGQLFPFERTHFEPSLKLNAKGDPELAKNGNPIYECKEKKVKYMLQGGRREYKIVGYAVPDNMVNTVLNGLNVGDGEVHPKSADLTVSALRKMMGAKKIPPAKERGNNTMPIPREGCAVYMIGIKEDQEALWLDEEGKPFKQENI